MKNRPYLLCVKGFSPYTIYAVPPIRVVSGLPFTLFTVMYYFTARRKPVRSNHSCTGPPNLSKLPAPNDTAVYVLSAVAHNYVYYVFAVSVSCENRSVHVQSDRRAVVNRRRQKVPPTRVPKTKFRKKLKIVGKNKICV